MFFYLTFFQELIIAYSYLSHLANDLQMFGQRMSNSATMIKTLWKNSRVFTRTLRETNVHIILGRDEHLVIGHIIHMILYLHYL